MMQPIKIIRGTTNVFVLNIYDESGQPYVISESDVLRFGVKKHPGDSTYVILKEQNGDENTDGKYEFEITPSDTQRALYGTYYYDIGIESGSDYYMVIECSPFEILNNVTGLEV